MGGEYESFLGDVPGAKMVVWFATVKGEVVRYSVVLVLLTPSGVETVRTFDCVHGFNEMHRYTREGGKQDGVVFAHGSLAEGLQAAIEAVKRGHRTMIEGWLGNEEL